MPPGKSLGLLIGGSAWDIGDFTVVYYILDIPQDRYTITGKLATDEMNPVSSSVRATLLT
jgi:hypothetical protein